MERLLLEIRRIGVRLTADRRRLALLCMLTAIGMVFWTRLILIDRQPASATAATIANIEDAGPKIEAPKAPMQVMLPERPQRNPFSVDAIFFPLGEETLLGSADSPKSGALAADLIAEAASRFRLGATLPPAAAVIDGATLRVGNEVPGSTEPRFTLVEVHRQHAVLEAQGRQFVLRME